MRTRPRNCRGFSLVELLLVCVVIVGLLAAIRPAMRGITQTSGRKGAVSMLLSGIEQTRATAIEQGTNAYLVIAALPSAAEGGDRDRYHFKAFAIFADTTSGTSPKQLTAWKTLPVGFAIQPPDQSRWPNMNVPILLGSSNPTEATISCPNLKFAPTGEVETPESGDIILELFAGFVDGQNTPRRTGAATSVDRIRVYRYTGRPRYETN